MTIESIKLDDNTEFKYDTSSQEFEGYLAAAAQIGVTNKDESFYLARNLEFLRQKVFEPKYAALKLLNNASLLNIDTSVPEGAETDTYVSVDSIGEAAVVGDFGDDIPTVEVTGQEYTNKIKSIATSYIYSAADVRKDKMLGAGLPSSATQRKLLVARRAVDQKLHSMLALGDAAYGITGMFDETIIDTTGTSVWASASVADILTDIKGALDSILDGSSGNEEANTMLLDYTSYALLAKKEMDTTNYSGMTMLKYIQDNYKLNVDYLVQLKSAFVGGTKSGFMVYDSSADKIQGVVPMRLNVHAPQMHNLATKNILEARCGGVRIYHPKSAHIVTGI